MVVGRVVDKVLHHLQHLTLCVELHLSMLALVALVVHQRDVGIHVHQIVLALILLNFALACREFIVDNRESLINEFSRIDCHLVLLHLAAAVVERDHSVEHIFATLHIAVFDIEVQAVTLFRDDAHRHLFIKVFSSHLVAGYANTHIQFLTGDVIFSGVEHKDTIIGLQRHREFLGSHFSKCLKPALLRLHFYLVALGIHLHFYTETYRQRVKHLIRCIERNRCLLVGIIFAHKSGLHIVGAVKPKLLHHLLYQRCRAKHNHLIIYVG